MIDKLSIDVKNVEINYENIRDVGFVQENENFLSLLIDNFVDFLKSKSGDIISTLQDIRMVSCLIPDSYLYIFNSKNFLSFLEEYFNSFNDNDEALFNGFIFINYMVENLKDFCKYIYKSNIAVASSNLITHENDQVAYYSASVFYNIILKSEDLIEGFDIEEMINNVKSLQYISHDGLILSTKILLVITQRYKIDNDIDSILLIFAEYLDLETLDMDVQINVCKSLLNLGYIHNTVSRKIWNSIVDSVIYNINRSDFSLSCKLYDDFIKFSFNFLNYVLSSYDDIMPRWVVSNEVIFNIILTQNINVDTTGIVLKYIKGIIERQLISVKYLHDTVKGFDEKGVFIKELIGYLQESNIQFIIKVTIVDIINLIFVKLNLQGNSIISDIINIISEQQYFLYVCQLVENLHHDSIIHFLNFLKHFYFYDQDSLLYLVEEFSVLQVLKELEDNHYNDISSLARDLLAQFQVSL